IGDVNRLSASLGIDKGILEEIRKEFDYWYPLDNRHSGKDLIPNHLTFMVFNHVAIFPPEKWPKRIVVNGHIMVEGMKMSKSLGNFITIDKALKEVSPDVLRLSLILGAEIGNDVNYTKQLTTTVTETLEGIYELVVSVNSSRYINEENMSESTVFLEKTLETKLHRLLQEINELMENYKFRSAAIKIYHEINNELKLHFKINGLYRSDLINRIIESWIKLMSPFTPAFAEELWHLTGHKSFVVNESWPDPSMFVKSDEHALFLKYIDTIVDDIDNLRNLFSDKKEVIIVASSSKPCYPAKAKSYLADNNQLRELTRLLAREGVPSPHDYARRIVAFLKNLTMDELNKIEKLCEYEVEILRKMSSYLEGLLNLKIETYSEEAPEAQEYIVKKKQFPLPMRPVIIFK
ncbi:MAG: class I tRNA ligase family protein, partial [Fervidicoccaceae archaeon]|nr:class I tRNA ligase family protein [Fervidicoccaceae archaeon]